MTDSDKNIARGQEDPAILTSSAATSVDVPQDYRSVLDELPQDEVSIPTAKLANSIYFRSNRLDSPSGTSEDSFRVMAFHDSSEWGQHVGDFPTEDEAQKAAVAWSSKFLNPEVTLPFMFLAGNPDKISHGRTLPRTSTTQQAPDAYWERDVPPPWLISVEGEHLITVEGKRPQVWTWNPTMTVWLSDQKGIVPPEHMKRLGCSYLCRCPTREEISRMREHKERDVSDYVGDEARVWRYLMYGEI